MITGDAMKDLYTANRFCTCCGKRLKGKFVWLELEQGKSTYLDPGNIAVEKSQGCFPFGMTCARRMGK